MEEGIESTRQIKSYRSSCLFHHRVSQRQPDQLVLWSVSFKLLCSKEGNESRLTSLSNPLSPVFLLLLVVCAMHIMESCASSIAGFKRPHPRLASFMSRLEGLAEKLKAIDSTGTVEQGSIPQATSSMVSLIIDHIRIWQHRLLESQAAISSSQQPEASEANQSVRHEMENAVMPVSSRLPAQVPSGPPSFDPASSYRTSGFNSSPSATGQPRSFNSSYMPTFGPQGFQAQNGDLLPPTIGGPAISDAEIDSILMNGGVMVNLRSALPSSSVPLDRSCLTTLKFSHSFFPLSFARYSFGQTWTLTCFQILRTESSNQTSGSYKMRFQA